MSTSVLEVVRLSTRYLAERGVDTPRLDAELITAHSLGLRRLDLYLQHDRPLTDSELAPMRSLLRRRGGGEPIAYLTGRREFFGRGFRVSPAVLVPRPETETLVRCVLEWARARPAGQGRLRILDLGTGSGCIAVTLAAELPTAEVTGIDVSDAAVAVAADNAAAHGVAEQVRLLARSWAAGPDGAPPHAGIGPVDVVVANPPYIPTAELASLMRDVREHEPALALDGGVDGLEATRTLLSVAAGLLASGGMVALEIDHRAAAAVCALVEATWPGAATRVVVDLAGRDRVVVGVVGG